ncbi:MAG TPA: UDP-glucose/GDP-mannose dehydrogenase family protein [Candidatus Dormibacteraeota bacterium]|jgi:UDPglucose 6-dehydrogenase
MGVDVAAYTGTLEPLVIVGAGYVGLVTGACLAGAGRDVTLVEVDAGRRDMIARGESPIFEPGLSELLADVIARGALAVRADLDGALRESHMVMIAVGTPSLPDGRADLRALDVVAAQVAAAAQPGTVVIIKSTVPPGTARRLRRLFGLSTAPIEVVSSPEFLREGTAINDINTASRLVVGGDNAHAIARVVSVLNPFQSPVLRTGNTTAELIKYGSNAFLATKISFINEMANLCDLLDADVDDVAMGMGLDPRIGSASMQAGLGFGGSCFPKDVAALEDAARREGVSFWMLRSAIEVNEQQRMRFVQKIRDAIGNHLETRRIALLGLAFKPGTDDMRHAPSIAIARRLLELGATVVAHDPVAMPVARELLPGLEFANDAYEAMAGADLVAIVTEWPEYVAIDWKRAGELVRRRVIVDGRNCLEPAAVAEHMFSYYSMGRPSVTTRMGRRSTDSVPAVELAREFVA